MPGVRPLGGGTEASWTYGGQLPHRSANGQVAQRGGLLPRGAEGPVRGQPEAGVQERPPRAGRQRLQLGQRGKARSRTPQVRGRLSRQTCCGRFQTRLISQTRRAALADDLSST